jgi:hypothetical protein
MGADVGYLPLPVRVVGSGCIIRAVARRFLTPANVCCHRLSVLFGARRHGGRMHYPQLGRAAECGGGH